MIDEVVDGLAGDAADGAVERPLHAVAVVDVARQVRLSGQLEAADLAVVHRLLHFHIILNKIYVTSRTTSFIRSSHRLNDRFKALYI